jgi:hypothetical protein
MRYATCQNIVSVKVGQPGRGLRTVRRVCGLPSSYDRNGLCVSCENAIHEMSEQHAEALEMNECRNYLMGDDSALETANWYAELTAACRKSRRMAEA